MKKYLEIINDKILEDGIAKPISRIDITELRDEDKHVALDNIVLTAGADKVVKVHVCRHDEGLPCELHDLADEFEELKQDSEDTLREWDPAAYIR